MKKELLFLFTIFLLINSSLILAAEIDDQLIASHENTASKEKIQLPGDELIMPAHEDTTKPGINPWNETIIISDTWQTIIGTFFGFNLKGINTNISVREALVLFAIFVMFLVVISDILKLTPFFKMDLVIISGETLAALIISILVSISGALINLKDLFINLVSYLVEKLTFGFMSESLTISSFFTALLIIISFVIIVLFFNAITPILERYSRVSRAQASGRLVAQKEIN